MVCRLGFLWIHHCLFPVQEDDCVNSGNFTLDYFWHGKSQGNEFRVKHKYNLKQKQFLKRMPYKNRGQRIYEILDHDNIE